jgi:hypothetical protein
MGCYGLSHLEKSWNMKVLQTQFRNAWHWCFLNKWYPTSPINNQHCRWQSCRRLPASSGSRQTNSQAFIWMNLVSIKQKSMVMFQLPRIWEMPITVNPRVYLGGSLRSGEERRERVTNNQLFACLEWSSNNGKDLWNFLKPSKTHLCFFEFPPNWWGLDIQT